VALIEAQIVVVEGHWDDRCLHMLRFAVRHHLSRLSRVYEAFASGASAMGARHVGFRPGLVDEHKPPWIDRRLTRLPALTPPGDVRAVLFGGAKAFF